MLLKHTRLILTTLSLALISACVCQAKPNIAVMRFTGSGSNEVEGLRAALGAALTNSQKFQVVEHSSSELDQIAAEQKISLSGMIDPETAVAVGKLIGAKYLACAQIIKYSHTRERVKDEDGHSSYEDAYDVSVNYKVMTAETGTVVSQRIVSCSSKGSDSATSILDDIFGTKTQKVKNDPQANLMDLLCNTAPQFVKFLQLENKGKVIESMKDGILIVNLGSDHGIGIDTQFKIGTVGEPVMDDEGNIIGYKDGGDPVYAFPIKDKIQPKMCYLATGYWKSVKTGLFGGTERQWRTLQGDKSIIKDAALVAKLSSVKKGDEVTAGVSDY